MHKMRMLLVLGIWVAVLPYLGFPYSWKDALTTLSGLGFVYASLLLYREFKVKENKEETFDNFSENKFWGEEKKEEEMENKPEKEERLG